MAGLKGFLNNRFGSLQGDETSIDFLQGALTSIKDDGGTVEDILELLPILESGTGQSIEKPEEQRRLAADIAELFGINANSSETAEEIEHLGKLSKPLTMLSLNEDKESKCAGIESIPDAIAGEKGKKGRKKKRDRIKSRRKANKETSKNLDAKESEQDKESFSTKRFERFHKTWQGNENWKVHDHALTLATEELDDDDYSSAWLECLRKGIPWGGRGAGGRGIQRVTGETKDIKIPNVSMSRGHNALLEDATLLLVRGKRYGLVGKNGVGKTTLLRRMARGSLPGFPPWVRVQYVEQELQGSEDSPVEYVLKYDFERTRLLLEEEKLLNDESKDVEGKRLSEIYDRLDQIEAFDAPNRAEAALRSLGFDDRKLGLPTNQLSGGWRIRVALAGAIFMDPDILLMDEPTNHLDVLASEWLKRYLSTEYKGTIFFVSHDQSFLDTVSSDIIEFRNKKLYYFSGNYSEYRKFLSEQRRNVEKSASATQKKTEQMKKYVEKQRRDANKAKSDQKKQAQIRSKEKRIHKLSQGKNTGTSYSYSQLKYSDLDAIENAPAAYRTQASGKILKVQAYDPGKPVTFKFHECEKQQDHELINLSEVSGGYENSPPLFSQVTAQIMSSSKIALIGANGIGKSTLLKCMLGQLPLLEGEIRSNVKNIGYFSQNEIEKLDKKLTAVEALIQRARQLSKGTFSEVDARGWLGKFSLTGKQQLQKIETLSGGQKSRVVLALETLSEPSLVVLDEPTNHLDLDSIEALSKGIKDFGGAVVIVSHDIHFIAQCCKDLWILRKKKKKNRSMSKNEALSELTIIRDCDDFFREFNNYLKTQDIRSA